MAGTALKRLMAEYKRESGVSKHLFHPIYVVSTQAVLIVP